MSRRTLASAVVACLLLVLASVAAFLPVPYVTMSPGPTVDVLAKAKKDGKEIITVSGHKTYPTEGDLRLTTVSVTNPAQKVHLVSVLGAWFDGTRAVYPRDVIYPPDKSAEESEQESSVEMVSSQDTSIAAALGELGYELPLQIEVLAVTKGSPAAGQLRVRDKIREINGVPIRRIGQVTKAVQQTGVGKTATFVVRRGSTDETVELTAEASKDDPDTAVVGVQIGTGYDFPFEVSVRLDQDIGGPSAGLIFSLGVYDKLTPGPLSGGNDIAGTGTITAAGRVGPIGGIQQKIVAAADAGAKIFLVPAANCESARHADVKKGEIRLVKAATLHSAVTSLEAYAKDPSADLPACG
jgi:PDZ domain-containing protein